MFELTFIWRKVCIRIVLKSSLDFFFAQTKKINNFPTIVNGVFNMIDHFIKLYAISGILYPSQASDIAR